MLYASGGSSSVTVNSIKPNARSNIAVPLSSLSDCEIIKESLADSELLSYNATTGKWSNITQTPTTYPFSLFQGLSQKGIANGYAGLYSFSHIPITKIPDLHKAKLQIFQHLCQL